jgi:hypothetical protein
METSVARDKVILIVWGLGNCLALGLFGFTDLLILRILGAMWLAGAISLAGLVTIGGLFGEDQ